MSPRVITLDTETTGLDWQNEKILLCGYTVDGEKEVYYSETPQGVLNTLLAEPSNILRGHNIKFDALVLANAGYEVNCQLEDTRVMAYHCWPDEPSHSLKALVRSKLRGNPTELSDLLFKPLKKDLSYLNLDEYYQFSDGKLARKDLLKAYHIEDILNVDRLRAILNPTDWFNEVERPLTRLLFETELYGCPLDKRYLNLLQYELELRTLALLNSLQQGTDFNPGSSQQVAKKFQELGYNLDELCEKTEKGAYQVDKTFLKNLAWKGDKVAKDLLEYRKLTKILGTYIEPFIKGVEKDGRLHGSFNQAGSEDRYGEGGRGTQTGRLSSSDPNLQNIPSRTEEGKKVRKAFTASEGKTLFDSDLKQIEPRLVGHYSQSPKLIKAYNEGLDTHGLMAHSIFCGCNHPSPLGEEHSRSIRAITPTERFIGKTSWLATVYGCGYRKLLYICENFSDSPLELDVREFYPMWQTLTAREIRKLGLRPGNHEDREVYARWMFFKRVQDTFKRNNPEIMGWRDEHIRRTCRLGYVVTIGGRRLEVKGLDSFNIREKLDAERKAVNYLIQGSAADIMKLILVRFGNDFVKKGYGKVFATVHDEVLGELNDPSSISMVKNIMETTVRLRNVPIESDTKIVKNWGDK